MSKKRNPVWTRDETILALEVYYIMKERGINNSRIAEMKGTAKIINDLNKYVFKNDVVRTESSIYKKILNIVNVDEDNVSNGQVNGSKLDKEVWEEFKNNQRLLTQHLKEIKGRIQVSKRLESVVLPTVKSNGRIREYKQYSEQIKSKILYEHLFNDKVHRWLDINIIGKDGGTNGRVSANILYYIGLKAEYRGIFKDYTVEEVLPFLKSKGKDFEDVFRLLKIYSQQDIYNSKQIDDDLEALRVEEGNRVEGVKKGYYINRYERDPKNRARAIEIHGVTCFACEFNFEDMYGERGKDYIEIHHTKPLSQLDGPMQIDPEHDLIPLCANCHRMVHRSQYDVLSLEELKEIINHNKRTT